MIQSCPPAKFLHGITSRYSFEFDKIYGRLNVEGKTVVDIGAYNGDSASYFLRKGAKMVICFQCGDDKVLLCNLEPYIQKGMIKVYPCWSGQEVAGDVLKMDCEGCERKLTSEYLNQFPQWSIGIHQFTLGGYEHKRLVGMLLDSGGTKIDSNIIEKVYQKTLKD